MKKLSRNVSNRNLILIWRFYGVTDLQLVQQLTCWTFLRIVVRLKSMNKFLFYRHLILKAKHYRRRIIRSLDSIDAYMCDLV